jgi:hypothetical protein
VVGADPTDRDVERRLPDLFQRGDGHSRVTYKDGTRSLDIAHVPDRRLYVVSLPDRKGVEMVLPELRAMFRYVVVDAPSRAGRGIGIARILLHHLDVLLIASGLRADELADARLYVEQLAQMPAAAAVDVGVLAMGEVEPGGLEEEQLRRRLAALPTIARVPRMTNSSADGTGDLDGLEAVVDLLARREARRWGTSSLRATARHVAYEFYRRAGAARA